MPNLVNQTFFIGDIVIPNLTHTADIDRITNFIDKHEPECLRKILGYSLFKLVGVESSQRMTDLLDGAEYIDGAGDLQKWNGLVHNTTISLIAYYVYFYYQKWQASQSSGVGTNVPKAEAGVSISPREKQVTAWNNFSSEVESMACFLWLKKNGSGVRVYPEFSYHQFCETRRISRRIDSVFEF